MNLMGKNKPPAVTAAPEPATPSVPEIVAKMQRELQQVEREICVREQEIREFNVRAAALAADIQWLLRTPQAVTILTSLLRRNGVSV